MEYGLQLVNTIGDSSIIKKLESTQLKVIRILLRLAWNTSVQAIRRLFKLESMETRRNILMAKYFRRVRNLGEFNTMAHNMWRRANQLTHWETYTGCLSYQNPIFIKVVKSNTLKKDLIEIKRRDIMDYTKGSFGQSQTRIAECITVDEELKSHRILSWKNQAEAKRNKDIIYWRLGRVAMHQECLNCNKEMLSRKHAVMCSGVEDQLIRSYPDIEIYSDRTIIDELLIKCGTMENSKIWGDVQWAINQIRRLCRLQTD
jgi:hypothetical protein